MKRSVLIVDDEFGLADVLSDLLQEDGYDVTIATNGALGLERLKAHPPDAAIVDVMMPVMDGPTMVRAMRADPKLAKIPVLMITAVPQALPTELPLLYDVAFTKPFSAEEMFAALDQLLGRRR